MSSERPAYTLASLRAFADARRHDLACRRDRRGFWPGEEVEHEVMEAIMALIDRIAGDPVILERLKGAR